MMSNIFVRSLKEDGNIVICPCCGKRINKNNDIIKKHLFVTEGQSKDIHIHGDIGNPIIMEKFTDEIIHHSNLNHKYIKVNKSIKDLKEVVFHNRQRIGDILMFTAGVRDFKKAYPDVKVGILSTARHIWDFNPNVDLDLLGTDENTIKIGPSKLTTMSNRVDWHFSNAFRMSIENALNITIPQTASKPDIWLTEEEYNAPPITKKPYWLITIGGEKGWGCKMYPFEHWQEFVNQNKDILFYQLGTNEDDHPRLQGDNIIDYVGKTQDRNTGIRELFQLFLNAEGSIGLVSFQMHLAAAFNKPCIVIAGAREPVSFTRYPGSRYLTTDGCLPCAIKACWHCNIDTCEHLIMYPNRKIELDKKVPQCVDLIKPEDITRELLYYYKGGRLKKGVQSPKIEFNNVVPTPKKVIIKPIEIPKTEFSFGGGSITENDWRFILKTIDSHKVNSILEFGTGLSTILFNKKVDTVISYETNSSWIKKLKNIDNNYVIKQWNGKEESFNILTSNIDLIFVDGPAGGQSREFSTKIASEQSNIVIIHDAGREHERKWQDKYLKEKFNGPHKGGHRCHLWIRKEYYNSFREEENKKEEIKRNKKVKGKFIKFVSTARGWGGCARSVTTIMKRLLKEGHKVEFIPFRNKVTSSEFKEILSNELKDVIVTENYNTLQEHCDVLFMYADDYIWEFNQPEMSDAFSNINADRKIMMLNYRRGSVGQVEWTKGWDKYMFLNSAQEKDLLSLLPDVKTKVLPPCTELDVFFENKIDYDKNIRIVRHSSQGNAKFSKEFEVEIQKMIRCQVGITISMLPGPSFVHEIASKFYKYNRTASSVDIANFLRNGNLFWYSLPIGYMDMGPRVIIEAMASGLPILADNWGGAVDRVNSECGWLCDTKDQMVEIVQHVTLKELKQKGEAARERAKTFTPESWIKEIVL